MTGATDRVIAFAKERFLDLIENVLDDPFWIRDEPDPAEILAGFRMLAADLGYDYELLINELGTGDESKRFRDFEISYGVRQP